MFISHGDCLEDAEFVAGEVRRRLGVETVHINYVGPVIGNHSGPGTMRCFSLAANDNYAKIVWGNPQTIFAMQTHSKIRNVPFPRPCGATGNDAQKLHAPAFAHFRGAVLTHEVLCRAAGGFLPQSPAATAPSY